MAGAYATTHAPRPAHRRPWKGEAPLASTQASVENSQAAVKTARANTNSAKANIERSKVALTDVRRTLERNQILLRQALIAQSDLDPAQTANESGVAQLKLSEA